MSNLHSYISSTGIARAVAAVVLGGALASSASAANLYWDSTPVPADPGFGSAAGNWDSQSVTSGGGVWSTSATGVLAGDPNQATSNADIFNFGTATDGLGSGTINLNATISSGNLVFGAASGAITLTGGGLQFGTSKVLTTNSTTNSVTIESLISGANGFNKNGNGTLILTADNTYAGATSITNNGTLIISGDNSARTGNMTLSTSSGAIPKLHINSATALGSGTLVFGGGGATDTVRLDNSSAGAITVSTANPITMNRNFSFAGTQDLNLGTGTATIGGLTTGSPRIITVLAKTLTIGGTVAEAVSNVGITKAGVGTLVLEGNNTYTGATIVNNGKLVINGSLNASSAVAVNTGTLGGSGTIGGNVTVGNATVAPGTSPGTIVIDGNFNLASGSILAFELTAGDTTVGGGVNDLIDGVNDLTLDGTLNVTSSPLGVGTWRLLNYSGTLSDNLLGLGTVSLLPFHTASVDTSVTGQVNLVVIPEPATLGVLAMGATGLMRRRRIG